MINCINPPVRNRYVIRTSEPKRNAAPLTPEDYINIGYMSGRFGVNLNNPNEPNNIYEDKSGLYVDINSCCTPLFETSLNQSGIKFDRIA